ncbi:hypothetical protein [Paenibacillus sp. DMB20]|uniref:hypothetical protein n=1 Tax=Paenibacillus sp. DMB20 TaxID=1642570 RepID=UPI000627B734|nr:hypothetical protein [Paenibacillus sp. DMB20]KKO51867.1 hypothetical protein XI25_23395 [Paenibacillus sp. DMB20]
MDQRAAMLKIENHKPSLNKLDALIIFGNFIFCPVFFPLGILRVIFTHRRNSRKAINFRFINYQLVAIFFALTLLLWWGVIENPEVKEDFILVIVVLGIFFIIPMLVIQLLEWRARDRFRKLMRIYHEALCIYNLRKIDRIAGTVGQPTQRVHEDLTYMMEHQLLPDGDVGEGSVWFEQALVEEADNNVITTVDDDVNVAYRGTQAASPMMKRQLQAN